MDFSEILKNTSEEFDKLERSLLEIENAYEQMLVCSSDEIEDISFKIEKSKQDADVCLVKINQYCDADETGIIKKAAGALTKHCETDSRAEEIFQKKQAVNAVKTRILDIISAVGERIRLKEEETLMLIKECNQSKEANASKYYSDDAKEFDYRHGRSKAI